MIMITPGTIYLGLAIVLITTGFAVAFGWAVGSYTSNRKTPEPAPPIHRPPVVQALPRSGRLPAEAEQTAIEIGRWWPGIERTAQPRTIPLSHVEVSNWEKNLRRRQDAWEHLHRSPDVQR